MKKICCLAMASLFAVSTIHATLVRENFATDPALDGWQVFGDTNLFSWDSTNQVLDVTWDSTQSNSYFYHPLGQTYTRNDGFYVQFDLQLADATAYDYGMQVAVGLLHLADATNAVFSRPDLTAPNVCEFDYFPAIDYQGYSYPNNVAATLVDDSGTNLSLASDLFTPAPGVIYRVNFVHQPGAETISCTISTGGQVVSALPVTQVFNGPVGDFQVDTLSITSYEDDGYGDSILAHGTVGNLAFASPLPVTFIQTAAAGQVQFASDTNWLYTLEQSADLQSWTAAAPAVFGNGTNLLLQATNPPAGPAFYRVHADLP